MFLLILFVVEVIMSFYAFQAVRAATSVSWIHYLYIVLNVLIFANFFFRVIGASPWTFTGARAYALGFLLMLFAFQIVVILFLFSEDIFRIIKYIIHYKSNSSSQNHLPSRRSFIAKTALAVAAIPFASLLYGMIKGKYNYKVLKYDLEFDDLPDEFDGYKIAQISDIHCGSFDNREKIKYGVDLLKEQNADTIFFTGDLVNNGASEMEDWKDLFGSISAPDGVFSILGNHDYGMYYPWRNKVEQEKNLNHLKSIQKEMGWDLLLNENRQIEKNKQKINIVGVENWGDGTFPKFGDLEKAGEGLTAKDFKILLSHDPSHWDKVAQKNDKNYQLTLSGHTHGMQFGIEIPGVVKWSPVKYRYKYWAGIYKEQERYINVNRGFGYLAYPGRVGMWPEITVIRLRKKQV